MQAPLSPDEQISHIEHSVASLPPGRVRDALYDTLTKLQLSTAGTIGGTTISLLRGGLKRGTSLKPPPHAPLLSAGAPRFPFPSVHSAHGALALALHARLLAYGFLTLRAGVHAAAPSVPGFAPPISSVSQAELVPADWTPADGAEKTFVVRYVHPRYKAVASAPGLLVCCTSSVSMLEVEASLPQQPPTAATAGPPRTVRICFELAALTGTAPDAAFLVSAPPKGPPQRPFAHLAALLSPLFDPDASAAFCARIHAELLTPLLPALHEVPALDGASHVPPGTGSSAALVVAAAASQPAQQPMSSEKPQQQQQQQQAQPVVPQSSVPHIPARTTGRPDSGWPLPTPDTWGRGGGDFDGDLLPAGLRGVGGGVGEFGWLPRGGGSGESFGGGGSLVGPDHPLFRGRHGGDGDDFRFIPGRGPGPLPPGVPPGARFDPFGPPGVFPGPPGPPPGWQGGRLGGSAPSTTFFGPAPDHLPPPPDAGFGEAGLGFRESHPQARTGQQLLAQPHPPLQRAPLPTGSSDSAAAPATGSPAKQDDVPDYIW